MSALRNRLCSHATSLCRVLWVRGRRAPSKEKRKSLSWSLANFLCPVDAGHNLLGPPPFFFLKRGTTALPSENWSHARRKVEKIQALAPLALGKSKNTVSLPGLSGAEPLLLIYIRAATPTFPSLRGCMDPSLGGGVVGVTWSFSLHPRHLLFAELSWTRARHDPSQELKGQVLGGYLGALRHRSRCAGAFPSPPLLTLAPVPHDLGVLFMFLRPAA